MTIVAYHSVSVRDHPLAVSPDVFARQLDRFARFEVLTLREYASRIAIDTSMHGCVALTFDDGYTDFAETVLPMLLARGYPATAFVSPGLAGATLLVDDAGTGIDRSWPLMDWDAIHTVTAQKIEVASHSVTHALLTDLDDDSLWKEVTESKRLLEEGIERPVESFCYPGGRYDERVLAAVAAAGYARAVVTPRASRRARGALALPRVGIYRKDDMVRFMVKISRAGRWILRARHVAADAR
jgi:peptidoglycan/xylan/chitin deacetylase (PgdA/CDA1 family)